MMNVDKALKAMFERYQFYADEAIQKLKMGEKEMAQYYFNKAQGINEGAKSMLGYRYEKDVFDIKSVQTVDAYEVNDE